ncbi:MAG TPA: tryptophan 7-halogenase [Stellaceae bacterium]|nr:tryptophan 7-halogenase [Stellaceae bacterium]
MLVLRGEDGLILPDRVVADFDVLIAGAGPAGCATAMSLADFAPELRVGVADAGAVGEHRIGETVPPQIEPVLAHLGLRELFLRGGHCPSYRTMASWGRGRLGTNEFLLHAHQTGWRLDRAAFDGMLVDAASARAACFLKANAKALVQGPEGWRLSLSDGTEHRARFVVDATGNPATLARQCGLARTNIDRLVGCSLRVGSRSDGTEGLMIESFPEGWWYTSAVPRGGRVVVCMTDADHARSLRLSRVDRFTELLSRTSHVRRVVEIGQAPGRPTIAPASSRLIAIDPALPLLCVGDAGSRYDPVSGQGIVKALRSGIFASYAIADWLCRRDQRGLARYRLMLNHEFAAYRETLQQFYALEQRWPANPFWHRRHGGLISLGE